jgi:hypothetical protein
VRVYYLTQFKTPQSLEDLVQAGCIQKLPAPPPGKIFRLNDDQTEVLLKSM